MLISEEEKYLRTLSKTKKLNMNFIIEFWSKMKLVFLSDSESLINKDIQNELVNIFKGTNYTFGYIPSQTNKDSKYFDNIKKSFSKAGIRKFVIFDLDKEYDPDRINELQKCDIIFLSGGNTFYFLNLIKKRKFDKILKKFAQEGKIIIGLSAGAMIMTSSIYITVVKGRSENKVELKNFSGLDLVNFEYSPHYDDSNDLKEKFLGYSTQTNRPIYAGFDGSVIIIDGNHEKIIGKVVKFSKGKISEVR